MAKCFAEAVLKMDHKLSGAVEGCEVLSSPKNKKLVNIKNGTSLPDNLLVYESELSSPKSFYNGLEETQVVEQRTPFRTPLQSLSSSDSDNQDQSIHWTTPVDKSRFTPRGSERKQFWQQRVDRLYSPGALVQGFFRRSRELTRLPLESEDMEKSQTPSLACLRSLRSRCKKIGSEKGDVNGSSEPLVIESEPSEVLHDVQPAAAEVILPVEIESAERCPHNVAVPEQETMESGNCDGHYFLKVLKKEMDRLENLASEAERELADGDSLPDDARGKLRVASCKARLLMKQKMQQFHGLCKINISSKDDEEFPTTNEDLAGFWDMVKLQVNHIDQMFEELNVLRKANWVEKTEDSAVVVRKRRSVSKPVLSKPVLTEKQLAIRDATRKAREEFRRKIMQERLKLQNEALV
ncbi:disks large-associated protein 5 [Anabrus simplex]|uniref:disks large-associated protein 5 n=1 Tax=Anabrus simplex TaxID=316456 RepID=UPI0035A380DC